MNQAARARLIPVQAGAASKLQRAQEQWRVQLRERHFRPWRIDHDLKAVADCLHDLGPPARWSDQELEARFRRRRGGRALADTPLAEIAVRRFWDFYRHPEETVLETEILAAWRDLLMDKGYKVETYEKYRDGVLLFTDANGPVWRGSKRTFNHFGAGRRDAGAARETQRGVQIAVRGFINFIRADEEFVEAIHALTGCEVRQLCTPENTLAHLHSTPEGEVGRSPTDVELRTFFAHLRARIQGAWHYHRKGRWTAERDYGMFQLMLATGARDICFEGFRLRDLPQAYGERARFSRFEHAHFLSKSEPGGNLKERFVPAIEIFAAQWAAFDRYLRVGRKHLVGAESGDAVFLSERGGPLSANDISRIFREHRRAAGLPEDLHAHCLRHYFAQKLRQIGVELGVIQKLLGHNTEATSARYAKLTPAYINQHLLECGRRQRRESDACA